MKLKLMFVLLMTLLSTQAFSASIKCLGISENNFIRLDVEIPGLTSLNESSGTVFIDGEEVATFQEGEVAVGLLGLTFVGKNYIGDEVEGKVIDLNKREGLITKLKIKSRNVQIRYVRVKC